MNKEKLRRNYPVPLGEFRSERGPFANFIWDFIHAKRIEHGLSTRDLGDITESSQSNVSAAENGNRTIGVATTQRALRIFGYKLVIRPINAEPVEGDIE